ncbi:predicted protein [Streptomyces viridosporus ATCC 14672]|uniref:Predicted protein n=1 Tax=Streptomyces viridosporus (strain ATCC 14672 / DSM 40746 / JCM 4963 / KCTC 9882 / NRRL B-12104 / FH 1290) TaxID=566461 RepID=D5ZNH5_STRV1|nr:predicted protein [Streptomyces viridosporus ATCC 14672]
MSAHRRGRAYPRRTCLLSSHSRLWELPWIRLLTRASTYSADEYGAAHPGAQSSWKAHLGDRRTTRPDPRGCPGLGNVYSGVVRASPLPPFPIAGACWDLCRGVRDGR